VCVVCMCVCVCVCVCVCAYTEHMPFAVMPLGLLQSGTHQEAREMEALNVHVK
jgi:hypothetical protein